MKHTPAPWAVWTEEEPGYLGSTISKYVAGVTGGPTNDTVIRFDDDYGTDQGADAKLIALAPSAPHKCNPDCPGEQNRRKLAAFDEIYAMVMYGCGPNFKEIKAVLTNYEGASHAPKG